MKLDRKVLIIVLEVIEENVNATADDSVRKYLIHSMPAVQIVELSSKMGVTSDLTSYTALHYAARKGLISAEWHSGGNGISSVKELLPDGYDYLSEHRGEKL